MINKIINYTEHSIITKIYFLGVLVYKLRHHIFLLLHKRQ